MLLFKRTEISHPIAPRQSSRQPPAVTSRSAAVNDVGSPPMGPRVPTHGSSVLPDLLQQQNPPLSSSPAPKGGYAMVERGAELIPPSVQHNEVSFLLSIVVQSCNS